MSCCAPPFSEQCHRHAGKFAGTPLLDWCSSITADTALMRRHQSMRRMIETAGLSQGKFGSLTFARLGGGSLANPLRAWRIFNGNAHAHRRAPPGRNAGGGAQRAPDRSEEPRVGKACSTSVRYSYSPYL